MRLSSILSKPPSFDFKEVDAFLLGKQGKCGQKVEINVGQIALNYYCENCEDLRTFYSQGRLSCIFVNKKLISIDSVLTCNCGSNVEAWFLVECESDFTIINPKVRILKHCERLSSTVRKPNHRFGEYELWLRKAEQAYREELGAGAIVYLRKIYEDVTIKAAQSLGINTHKANGNLRPFFQLIEEVDRSVHIVPPEFAENRYELFRELSDVVHGEYVESMGLRKFEPLNRLVIGILENIRNKRELIDAMRLLGWEEV